MRLFFIFYILTLFYFVNSFAITYSECYQQKLKTKQQQSEICNGNGKCHLFFGCQCFDGFDGEKCEVKIEKRNGCYLNKCFPGSECIEISSSQYYCECPANRYGNFCEFEDPCFDCSGKCFEIAEDIFECENSGKRQEKTVLIHSESTNSTFMESNVTVITKNATITTNETTTTKCIITDYCFTITDNNICDPLCNTEICNFDFNDCTFQNDSTTVYRNNKDTETQEIYEYIFYVILFFITFFTVVILLCLGKLVVNRWKKISAEIDAENAAIRAKYLVDESTYCVI